jgi:hypothetical protein
MKKKLQPGKTCCLVILFLFFSINFFGQETNSRASGRVFSDSNEIAAGIIVSLIHEPTQNKYANITGNDGYFHFFNLKPGGPYSITVSSAGYEILKINSLFIHLNSEHFLLDNTEIIDFRLQKKIITLDNVVINAGNKTKTGLETNTTSSLLRTMPTINRNFQDYVRLVPQAKVTGDGVMSLAAQNNRFNAFFIDGANSSDVQGLAVNGMNGGQTGSPPISIDAIEEINVLLSPYDVQYGNFTGGSMNAITRSGTNENKSSAWYYFRNEDLTGKSPQPIEKPGSPGEFYRPKLSSFFNQTFGLWNSGALIKNNLFYFVLFEKQAETRPQPFNIADYRGNSNHQQLQTLTNFLKDTYQYDPGSFLETKDELDATRLNIKIDWNASEKNKFTLSYRYNNAKRTNPRLLNSATFIAYENNGFTWATLTHTGSFEWNRFLKNKMNNRLLLTFTSQSDNRIRIGQPFPTVLIFDGEGQINFGSDLSTAINDLNATDLTLFNVFRYTEKKHVFTIGTDINYTTVDNKVIQAYFGYYEFSRVNDFMNNAYPGKFQCLYPLKDEPGNPAKFHTLRSSFFVNDEFRSATNLKLNFGLRLDANSVLSNPQEDKFFNDSAINIISKYYDLAGARSGKSMDPHWALSPRMSIDYKIPKYAIKLKAGAGIFLGHVINFWHFGVFNSVNGAIDITQPPYLTRFNPDPYDQPTAASLSIDTTRELNLIARKFKYPSLFRTSAAVEKKLWKSWKFSIEGIFTKNIHEAAFRSVNILPPAIKSSLPDARNIYSTGPKPPKIPLTSNGANPYSQLYLLTNNHDDKGYSYSFSFIIQKEATNFSFNGSYTFGRSSLLFEITGPQSLISSQWRNMETVNGRNFAPLSISDNDLQHRVAAWVSKKFDYGKGSTSTVISLFYNGQSGSPYSYVYNRSMINDNGKTGENFDLIYIPTENDLVSMVFVPIVNNSGQVDYSAQQQKDFLNAFIESDKYLKDHRGEFAKRNAARLPFTHIVDLRLQQNFTLKIKGKNIGLAVIYDVFNFTNMLNKNWGQTYFLTNDSYQLIRFSDYADPVTLIPRYQCRPFNGKPYSLQTSTQPGNSARWISQLGFKINL